MNQTELKTSSEAESKGAQKEKATAQHEVVELVLRAVDAYKKPSDSHDFLYWNK